MVIYYLNFIFKFNLFNLREGDTTVDSDLKRTMGYDLRQFIIIFFYFIPSFLFTKAISTYRKNFIIAIGIGAYCVLILAVYRLALFYNFMGLLLSLFFIRRYVKITVLFRKAIVIGILLVIVISFFNEYFIGLQKVLSGTMDYFSGKVEDKSADERFMNQVPILLGIIYNNFWTGCGVVMAVVTTRGAVMYGFVDFPILGSVATFGLIGMIIYYSRFYFILRNQNKNKFNTYRYFSEEEKLLFNILYSLRAYVIVMITFRFFYISWELAFDWQQSEFGLIVGSLLGLEYLIKQKEKKIYRKLNNNNTTILKN